MKAEVKDLIYFEGRAALSYGAEGVVLMFDVPPGESLPPEGDPVVVERNDGWLYRGAATDVRDLGKGIGAFFVSGLTREDVNVGVVVRTGAELWPSIVARERQKVTA